MTVPEIPPAPAGDDEAAAFLGEALGRGQAEAGGGAGDEDGGACEVHGPAF